MEEYDLLIVADATASMSNYLHALNTSLPQIISISALTGCFSRIGLLAYRDYGDDDLFEWSGWLYQNKRPNNMFHKQPDLVSIAQNLKAYGGGDYPEAVKTALAKAYEVMRSDAKTLVFLYTDAPPHTNCSERLSGNAAKEQKNLLKPGTFSGVASHFVDWVSASNIFRSGEKQAQVFAFLEGSMGWNHGAYYNFLSTLTGGACVYLPRSSSEVISKVTVELLLAWMGVEKIPATEGKNGDEDLPAELSRYVSVKGIKQAESEISKEIELFFPNADSPSCFVGRNITTTKVNADVLKQHLPKKQTPVLDFAERWKTDDHYKEIAINHLTNIIDTDVRAIALNPVFGTLWRAVCNDRTYSRHDEVVTAFSDSINQMKSAEEKVTMKSWLEESYDFTAEVHAIINSVPEEERFPCVLLDPTLKFATVAATNAEDDNCKDSISGLTRGDLLEIGRSCNPKILSRLSRILTRLTFVSSASEMPKHIEDTDTEQVPRIPLALTKEKYNRQFWKILFHLIVPGTRLSVRPAALVAALSLRVGVTPLMDAAVCETLRFKDKWNDASTPETWNIGCLTLLVDADETYRQHQQSTTENSTKITSLLHPNDRALFERLVAFKMLELNLGTLLNARVPWTPSKSVASIGPLALCRSCQYPRSVTIMGRSGKCGVCLATDYMDAKERESCITARALKDVTTTSEATWVECSVRSCRVQYIVYAVDDLNVRPKCHYCRFPANAKAPSQADAGAPFVECNKCLNRMIWPVAYRPTSFDESEFVCPPCTSGHATDTEVDLTARRIAVENTFSWLVRDTQDPDAVLFQNCTIFNVISAIGADGFLSRIELFPPHESFLVYQGKPIRNSATLISTLHEMVNNRKTAETDCSLCFSTFSPSTLNPACGRRGCVQRICTTCLHGWYGLNTPGSIINPAALACPFCRRFPTSRTLAKYGTGIHGVRDLANAVHGMGVSIYAWCKDCCTAKEFMERSCARGAPPELEDWSCNECAQERQRQSIERERQLAEQAAADARRAWDQRQIEQAERRRRRVEQAAAKLDLGNVKPCPKCGTFSEKISGCGHVKCPLSKCDVDWCFFCGEAFDASVIYGHMQDVHGGLFGDELDFDD